LAEEGLVTLVQPIEGIHGAVIDREVELIEPWRSMGRRRPSVRGTPVVEVPVDVTVEDPELGVADKRAD
jgi:hypothetical protein